jgi:hypothetical protein
MRIAILLVSVRIAILAPIPVSIWDYPHARMGVILFERGLDRFVGGGGDLGHQRLNLRVQGELLGE